MSSKTTSELASPPLFSGRTSNIALERTLIACGPITLVFIFIFFAASLLLPPISPSDTPASVAQHFEDNASGFKAGIMLYLLSGVLWPLFAAGISMQMSKIPDLPLTTLMLQMGGGCMAGGMLTLNAVFFAVATYRPGRDPIITQLASDLAFLTFPMTSTAWFVQELGLIWAVFCDQRSQPLMPRWIALVDAGMLLLWIPGYAAHMVYSGAVAWHGGLTFWAPWGTAVMLYVVGSIYLWKSTSRGNITT